MNSNILNINFGRLATLLLPMPLRTSGLTAILNVLTAPIAYILGILSGYRADKLQRLKYNGQVCRLEYCLNYRFGERSEINDLSYPDRIRVRDGTDSNGKPRIIYRRDSGEVYERVKRRGEPNQIILNRRYENNKTFYDFFVEIPASLRDKEKEIAAVVNTYKTQGKTWYLLIV